MVSLVSVNRLSTAFAACLVAAVGCKTSTSTTPTKHPQPTGENPSNTEPETTAPKTSGGEQAMAVYRALEAKIDAGEDTKDDRKQAYGEVVELDDGSNDYAFARAALAGRLAQARGLKAGKLVTEAETYARRVLEADPDYGEGAVVRMLGSLYVNAPARLVKHGDSETGLEMLEKEVSDHPDRVESRLRLAEAYVALGDPEPSFPHLCACIQNRASFGGDNQRLLGRLVDEVGGEEALGCGG